MNRHDGLEEKLVMMRLRLVAHTLRDRLKLHAKFNPDQPRVPAGHPDGGQWVGGGHASGGKPLLHDVSDSYADLIINLPFDELMGGHPISRHVNKSNTELISRLLLEKPTAVGTFSSIGDAETWVRKVLAYEYFQAKQVASGIKPAAALKVRFGTSTGREAYFNERYQAPAIRDTFGVLVYIYHEPRSPNGFVIHTAYPWNIDPMQKSIRSPRAFYYLTISFLPSYIPFADDETFVRFAYQQFMRDDPELLDELLEFLRRVLRMKLSAKQLEDILKYQSSAHSYGMSGDLHQLFSLMLEIGEKEAKTGRINEREALPLFLREKRQT